MKKDGADDADTTETVVSSVRLEYADVVEVAAPDNPDMNEHTYFVEYISDRKMRLRDVGGTHAAVSLAFDEQNVITDESITEIRLVSRSTTKGYARNNGLVAEKWIDLHFGGDLPVVVTGQITRLEGDMIEVALHPSLEVIYIDFEYKGLPEDFPLERVVVREKPASVDLAPTQDATKDGADSDSNGEDEDEDAKPKASVEYTSSNENIVTIPEDAEPDARLQDDLDKLYVSADSIVFGDDEARVSQIVDMGDKDKIYTIEAQVNSLLDEALASIPDDQRTGQVLAGVHRMIERFVELREAHSRISETGDVQGFTHKGSLHKPMANALGALDVEVGWVVPVVAARRRFYDVELLERAMPDAVSLSQEDSLSELEAAQQDYLLGKTTGNVSKYRAMLARVEAAIASFDPPAFPGETLTGAHREVRVPMDAVLGSLDDFYSTAIDKNHATRQRFVVQRYDSATTVVAGKDLTRAPGAFVREIAAPADDLAVRSLLVLPETIARFAAAARMPGASLLARTTTPEILLFRLMPLASVVAQTVVTDLDKETQYAFGEDKDETKGALPFAPKGGRGGLHEIALDDSLGTAHPDLYSRFLASSMPNTSALLADLASRAGAVYSTLDAARAIEPYFVYLDDFTHDHARAADKIAVAAIRQYGSDLKDRRRAFRVYRSANFGVRVERNALDVLLKEKKGASDTFTEEYGLDVSPDAGDAPPRSSSESLSRVLVGDRAQLLTLLLCFMLSSLRIPANFIDAASEAAARGEESDMTAPERIKPAADCTRRFVAKRYASVAALKADDKKDDLVYDADLDDTPYAVIAGYKRERAEMSARDFAEFLEKTLVAKHACPSAMAPEVAAALVAGKKPVRDGEYALLSLAPEIAKDAPDDARSRAAAEAEVRARTTKQYYRRQNSHWVLDDSVDEHAFTDSNTLFCNLSSKCVKNAAAGTCDSLAGAREASTARARLEAHARIERARETSDAEIADRVERAVRRMDRQRRLARLTRMTSNSIAVELARDFVAEDSTPSPFSALREFILAQDDFVKRQTDIVRFAESVGVCREPMLSVAAMGENPNWLYCVKTNKPLLPRFVYTLALAFVSGRSYTDEMDRVMRAQGVLSDDKGAVVDRHSGYVIQKIDFVDEQGYTDQGFRVVTHDVMEVDAGDAVARRLAGAPGAEGAVDFEDDGARLVYQILATVCATMGVPVESVFDLGMRIARESARLAVMSEAAYERKAQKSAEGAAKKKLPKYESYKNQTTLFVVAAAVLVAVQAMVPPFRPRITAPGCVASFAGYPREGAGDDRGIKYVACALAKSKSPFAPWDALKAVPTPMVEVAMRKILEEYVMPHADANGVTALFAKKAEYLILRPEDDVPAEHAAARWTGFLPPMTPFSVKGSLVAVSADFRRDFVELVRKGRPQQTEQAHAMRRSALRHGLGIVELVNEAVNEKELVFRNSAGAPLVKNACCNEAIEDEQELQSVFAYFVKLQPAIRSYDAAIRAIADVLTSLKESSHAPFLFHPGNTHVALPTAKTHFFNDNIYSAFIHYCNFDSPLPIPHYLLAVCPEKPVDKHYLAARSLAEKVDAFKRAGHTYSERDLGALLSAVARQRIVSLPEPAQYDVIQSMLDFIDHLDRSDSRAIEAPLRAHLLHVLAEYDPRKTIADDSARAASLTNYLALSTRRMRKDLGDFLAKHGNANKRDMRKFVGFMEAYAEWEIAKCTSGTEDGIFRVALSVKNTVRALSRVLPAAIAHKTPVGGVPKHWDLADIHERDILRFLRKSRERYERFFGDEVLCAVFDETQDAMLDLNRFVDTIPILASVRAPAHGDHPARDLYRLFDRRTLLLLLEYCWLSVFYEYMRASCETVPAKAVRSAQRRSAAAAAATAIFGETKEVEGYETGVADVDYSRQDPDMDAFDIQARSGVAETTKTRVAALLLAFMQITMDEKRQIDVPYREVEHGMSILRTLEKQGITDFLKNMEADERKAEFERKKLKLGRWALGLQKGIVDYDKAMYGREREAMNELFADEGWDDDGGAAYADESDLDAMQAREMLDVDDLTRRAEMDADAEADAEAYDMSDLDEDYRDEYEG